ncbi:MAG TPA: replication initiator [Pseudonocardiaceae bacterium]|nr:replication initiator [Pseudonocardiaceae bacterium]
MTLTPGTSHVPGVGAIAETFHRSLTAQFLNRAADPDYFKWINHIESSAGCSAPVRLHGNIHHVEASTGRIVRSVDTRTMPDAALYVACGNRRSVVCPSCSETYRGDTFQLVRAGLVGGKGVPETVVNHPCVFLTLTAPSFGPVHTSSVTRSGKPRPCRPRRTPDTCPHGAVLACTQVHADADPCVGTPLCGRCYDYPGHVVWNAFAGELWRRTTITANRALKALGDSLDNSPGASLRLSYAKVAEYQRRGLVHFHALIRLDGWHDPDEPGAIMAPDPAVTVEHLVQLLTTAAETTSFRTEPHPRRREGWSVGWGTQIDTRIVRLAPGDLDTKGEVTTTAVAAYLAKYATKATEATGFASARLTPETIRLYADPTTHMGRVVRACWSLGRRPRTLTTPEEREAWNAGYGRLRRWAHMLGFGGHFSTKSRRYSTTLGALRAARRDWQRTQHTTPPATGPVDNEHQADTDDSIVIISDLVFAGMGWHTTADAVLANSSAARAREKRQVAREEMTALIGG